jgi:hypothetical protein
MSNSESKSSITPPSTSLQKKNNRFKSQSAITTALTSGTTTGLMKFFKQNTSEQYQEQVHRETEESRMQFSKQKGMQGIHQAERLEKARASNCERQRRHRADLFRKQIKSGDRSPGGTKHKVSWKPV